MARWIRLDLRNSLYSSVAQVRSNVVAGWRLRRSMGHVRESDATCIDKKDGHVAPAMPRRASLADEISAMLDVRPSGEIDEDPDVDAATSFALHDEDLAGDEDAARPPRASRGHMRAAIDLGSDAAKYSGRVVSRGKLARQQQLARAQRAQEVEDDDDDDDEDDESESEGEGREEGDDDDDDDDEEEEEEKEEEEALTY